MTKKMPTRRPSSTVSAHGVRGHEVIWYAGMFWIITSHEHLVGNALIECDNGGYLNALDDGEFATIYELG